MNEAAKSCSQRKSPTQAQCPPPSRSRRTGTAPPGRTLDSLPGEPANADYPKKTLECVDPRLTFYQPSHNAASAMRNEVVRTLPRGLHSSLSSRRTGECRPSTKNSQSAPPADLQPAVPRRPQRHELEVLETFFLPSLVLPIKNQSHTKQTDQTHDFPEQPPRAG